MTEDEVRKDAQRRGWDDAWNTGKIYNGYAVYLYYDNTPPGVILTTGLPTYVLVKDDEIRYPADDEEYWAIRGLGDEDDEEEGEAEEAEA